MKHKFWKTIPMKLYLLLAAAVVFAFFSNDFGLVDIQKTAIVLAVGIDGTEDGFSLAAQISVPKGGDTNTGGTSSVDIVCEGETVSDCISQIYAKTGWVPKLIFCNLILIGEKTAKNGVLAALDYFLRNEYVTDSCHVAVCEGNADDFLSSVSATDDTSSLAIEKLFSDAAEKSGRTSRQTLREFAISAYGAGKSGYMPYLTMSPQAEEDGSEESGQTEEENGQAAQEAKTETKIYRAAQIALFAEGNMTGLLSEEETFAFHLLRGEISSGTLVSEENGAPVTLTVLKNKGNVSLDIKNAPVVSLSVKLKTRVYDRGVSAPISDVARSEPSEETLSFAKDKVAAAISSLWNASLECGCDLFELKTSLYRSSFQKFSEWKDDLLPLAKAQISVDVSAVK